MTGSAVLVVESEGIVLMTVSSLCLGALSVHSGLLCQTFCDSECIPFLLRFTRDMLPICNQEPLLVHHDLGRNLFFP